MSPVRTSLRWGTVRTSRGVKIYFLPTTEAMTYWDGWERMRFKAAMVEPGEVATRHGPFSLHGKNGLMYGRPLPSA